MKLRLATTPFILKRLLIRSWVAMRRRSLLLSEWAVPIQPSVRLRWRGVPVVGTVLDCRQDGSITRYRVRFTTLEGQPFEGYSQGFRLLPDVGYPVAARVGLRYHPRHPVPRRHRDGLPSDRHHHQPGDLPAEPMLLEFAEGLLQPVARRGWCWRRRWRL